MIHHDYTKMSATRRMELGKENAHPVQATPSQVSFADVLEIALDALTPYKDMSLHFLYQT